MGNLLVRVGLGLDHTHGRDTMLKHTQPTSHGRCGRKVVQGDVIPGRALSRPRPEVSRTGRIIAATPQVVDRLARAIGHERGRDPMHLQGWTFQEVQQPPAEGSRVVSTVQNPSQANTLSGDSSLRKTPAPAATSCHRMARAGTRFGVPPVVGQRRRAPRGRNSMQPSAGLLSFRSRQAC